MKKETVRCAVKKDSGDDPDVTKGILIFAEVRKAPSGVLIDGGEGVGRVTRPGLDQNVGEAAINSTPRRMIEETVRGVFKKTGYAGGVSVTISVPQGRELAHRTFNPRLGIEGGISIVGTSGIVEPMSSAALVDTIRLELSVLRGSGAREVLLTPGNYGERFAAEELGLDLSRRVVCSNFIGDAIDNAVLCGFEKILLVGHIGKLVKLGIGMLNTHSAYGDGRMETLAACALEGGAKPETLRALLPCVTTNAALVVLRDAKALDGTMSALARRIDECLTRRVPENVRIGFVCFTNEEGMSGALLQSENAGALMKSMKKSPDIL